jgi:hypothetical protein
MYYQHYDRFLRECPKPDQFRPDGRSVTLHELTHLDDAFHPDWEMFKKTTDYAYFFQKQRWKEMTPSQRLLNADSYAVYANTVAMHCD